jgi:hypothetical protein
MSLTNTGAASSLVKVQFLERPDPVYVGALEQEPIRESELYVAWV